MSTEQQSQVHEYKHRLTVIESAYIEQRQRADMVEEREKKLREVLEFYADDGNYMTSGYLGSSEIDKDKGYLAEKALDVS